jgi:hypothetical protein
MVGVARRPCVESLLLAVAPLLDLAPADVHEREGRR